MWGYNPDYSFLILPLLRNCIPRWCGVLIMDTVLAMDTVSTMDTASVTTSIIQVVITVLQVTKIARNVCNARRLDPRL